MNGPLPEDIKHAQAMEIGSRNLLLSIQNYQIRRKYGVPQKPCADTDMLWLGRMSAPEQNPDSMNSVKSREIYRRINQLTEAKRKLTVTDRDPCPRCNIRADIGCKHREASKPVKVFG